MVTPNIRAKIAKYRTQIARKQDQIVKLQRKIVTLEDSLQLKILLLLEHVNVSQGGLTTTQCAEFIQQGKFGVVDTSVTEEQVNSDLTQLCTQGLVRIRIDDPSIYCRTDRWPLWADTDKANRFRLIDRYNPES